MGNWVNPFEFHISPCGRFKKHLAQEECEFQIDKLIWHFQMKYLLPLWKTWSKTHTEGRCILKLTLPLWHTFTKSTRRGVWILNGVAHWLIFAESPTSVKKQNKTKQNKNKKKNKKQKTKTKTKKKQKNNSLLQPDYILQVLARSLTFFSCEHLMFHKQLKGFIAVYIPSKSISVVFWS